MPKGTEPEWEFNEYSKDASLVLHNFKDLSSEHDSIVAPSGEKQAY